MQEETIRRLIRDELDKEKQKTHIETPYASAQRMVRSVASSVVSAANQVDTTATQQQQHQDINHQRVTMMRQPHQFHQSPLPYRGKRKSHSSPGHPYRLNTPSNSSTRSSREEKPKTYEVVLLDVIGDKEDIYRLEEDEIVGTWYLDILPNMSELDIRKALVGVFETKLSLIKENDIEFVQCSRRMVKTPEIQNGLEWNASRLKALVGQGRLYCRLKLLCASSLICDLGVGEEEENDLSKDDNCKKGGIYNNFDTSKSADAAKNQQQIYGSTLSSTPCASSAMQNQDIPGSSTSMLPLTSCSSTGVSSRYETLINELLDQQSSSSSGSKFEKLGQSLDFLSNKLSEETDRLRIDPEYMLSDVLGFYKRQSFDAKRRIKVMYMDQPAIDTGGVVKQLYTDLFKLFEKGSPIEQFPPIFQGEVGRKMPVYSSVIASGDLFETIGKVLAHAIVQCGFCIANMAPFIYKYIVTGSIKSSLDNVSVEDVVNPKARHVLELV